MSSKPPAVYRLESQHQDGDAWAPLLDATRQPITFGGPSGKPRAVNMATLLCRYPSFFDLRVMKDGESDPVWNWKKTETTK